MSSRLTQLEDEVLEVVRAGSGLPASAIAKHLGRDRNQIRRVLLRLTDSGHVIAEEEAGGEGGGRFVFYSPDSPRNPLPDVLIKPSRECPSGIRPASSLQANADNVFFAAPSPRTSSKPLEGKFRIVDGPKPVRSTDLNTRVRHNTTGAHMHMTTTLPVPYGATGVVVHQSPATRRESRGQTRRRLDPMLQQIVMLAEVDPDATETNNMLLRRELAARNERDRIDQERQEHIKTLVPPPPTMFDQAVRFAAAMQQARAAGSKRSSNPEGRLADQPSRADDVDEEVYEPREVRRVDPRDRKRELTAQEAASSIHPSEFAGRRELSARPPPRKRPAQPVSFTAS